MRDPVGHQTLLSARFPSALWPFSAQSGWNFVHQQLANMPLVRPTRAAKSSNVSGVSALIVWSDMLGNVPKIPDVRHPVAVDRAVS